MAKEAEIRMRCPYCGRNKAEKFKQFIYIGKTKYKKIICRFCGELLILEEVN